MQSVPDNKETGIVAKVSVRGDFCFLRRAVDGADFLFLHFTKTLSALAPPHTFRFGQQWKYTVGAGGRPGELQATNATELCRP